MGGGKKKPTKNPRDFRFSFPQESSFITNSRLWWFTNMNKTQALPSTRTIFLLFFSTAGRSARLISPFFSCTRASAGSATSSLDFFFTFLGTTVGSSSLSSVKVIFVICLTEDFPRRSDSLLTALALADWTRAFFSICVAGELPMRLASFFFLKLAFKISASYSGSVFFIFFMVALLIWSASFLFGGLCSATDNPVLC